MGLPPRQTARASVWLESFTPSGRCHRQPPHPQYPASPSREADKPQVSGVSIGSGHWMRNGPAIGHQSPLRECQCNDLILVCAKGIDLHCILR